LAQLQNVPLAPSQRVEEAIVQEVNRLEQDVSTLQARRAHSSFLALRDWLGRNIRLSEITTALLLEFQRHRLKVAARDTVKKDMGLIMRLLRQNGHRIDRPPAPVTGQFHPNRAFTDEELEKLAPHIPDGYRTLYATLLATGARVAELVPSSKSSHVPLLKNEVDLEQGFVTIRTSKCRPGSRSEIRHVPVSEELLALLKEQMEQTPGPHVFPRSTLLWRPFLKALKRAGIPQMNELGEKLSLHSFRHTFGTKAAQFVGGNQFLVQKMLGHKQITTTARYCHPQAPYLTALEEPLLRGRSGDVGQPVGQVVELAFGKAG
jgi:integrase